MSANAKPTPADIAKILDAHQKWVAGEPGGARADLRGADFSGADLSRADLRNAVLRNAVLRDADFSGADLRGADFSGADFSGAILIGADFSGAILIGADFSGAILIGADFSAADFSAADFSAANLRYALLSDANFTGAKFPSAYGPIPRVENLDEKILDAVTASPASFSMGSWHGTTPACGTSHCRAGWAVTLAGAAGKALEDRLGTSAAGALIYAASTGRVPDFYANTKTALADIRKCAGAAADDAG